MDFFRFVAEAGGSKMGRPGAGAAKKGGGGEAAPQPWPLWTECHTYLGDLPELLVQLEESLEDSLLDPGHEFLL